MLFAAAALLAVAAPTGAQHADVVVWSEPDDPLRPTALRIADVESAPLVSSFREAVETGAPYVLWVAAADRLSDSVLVRLGRALLPEGSPAIGLITGSDPLEALAFWMRGRHPVLGLAAAAVSSGSRSGDRAGISIWRNEALEEHTPLTTDAFVGVLARAGYVTFAGHGTSRYLRLAESQLLTSEALSTLPRTVLATASCNAFRPWTAGALVPAFVERGAAAFAGFVYSPVSGYLLGAYGDLAFRHAWPGFPIGRIAQVQARGTLRAFAAFPFYFLAGDPRIAFRTDAPYRVAADREEGPERVIRLRDAPAGILPVRIQGGADYEFLAVTGVSAGSSGDPFYNGRLQWLDRDGDRYLLVRQPGGVVEIRLRRTVPLAWRLADPARDALDHALLLPNASDRAIAVVAAALALAVFLWRRRGREPVPATAWVTAGALGMALAMLHAVYMAVRADAVTVTSGVVAFRPAGALATLALTGVAGLVYLTATSRRGQVTAVLLALLPTWGGAVFWVLFTAVFNLAVFRRMFGATLYDPVPAQLFGLAALVLAPLLIAAFAAADNWLKRRPRKVSTGIAPAAAPAAG